MRFSRAALIAAGTLAVACTDHPATDPRIDPRSAAGARRPAAAPAASTDNAIVSDDFESGTLSLWQDGINASKQQILNNASLAHGGTHVLRVTYPAGQSGGWLTRFFMPGVDSAYVSYWVRLDSNWIGRTALLTLRGSRIDNQWSSFGKAGVCPSGTDFFVTSVVAGAASDPLDLAFSTYYPGMPRNSSGGCTGQSAGSATSYAGTRRLTPGGWHQIELWVRLNTVGQSDGLERVWLDGQLVGEWSGLTFRTSRILALNSVMLDGAATAPQTQHLYIDDVRVLAAPPTTPPPPPPPAPVAAVAVTLASSNLTVGQSTRATARLSDADGNVLTGRRIVWSSSDARVATVDTTGFVRTLAAGTVAISATSEGVAGSASLGVSPAPVSAVSVALNASSLTIGQTTQAVATLRDANGTVLTGRGVAWSSSNPGVAAVSATGLVTAVAPGSASIVATSEGKSGSATVSVVANSGGGGGGVDTLFADGFESGTLGDPGRWQDRVGNGSSIVTASNEGIAAASGTRVLRMGASGGAITHFVSTASTSPYEHLYLSFKMYVPTSYQSANPGLRAGGIRGSTTQYGSFGVGYGTQGSCPDDPNNANRQEFMFAYVFQDKAGWVLRTYTEWLDELELSNNPPTCGGGYALAAGNNPPATYYDLHFSPAANAWHQYEVEVQLNDVGQANGWQRTWVDGVLKIAHLNVRYRTTNGMKLWAVTFDGGTIPSGAYYVDDVLVSTRRAP